MEAYNRFMKCVFKWERSLLKCVGHDILAPKFKQTPMTFLTYVTLLSVAITEIYTFLNYGMMEKMFSLHAFSMTIQV